MHVDILWSVKEINHDGDENVQGPARVVRREWVGGAKEGGTRRFRVGSSPWWVWALL
jgi:hypothetical protein